jgi:rubrerythrin
VSITFNADEIFEMAEQIERNGASFYREAASKTKDAPTKKFLTDLGTMEDGHLAIFQVMRKELGKADKEPVTFDPDNQAAAYLQAMADAKGYEGKISPGLKLSGRETLSDILSIAINAERNSVVFYVGLKTLVQTDPSRKRVERIIGEEMGHIAVLQKKLLSL